MSNLDRFLTEGAYTCAGSLIYKNAEVGTFNAGELQLNTAGQAVLEKLDGITDVEVKAPVVAAIPAALDPSDEEAALDKLLAG